MEITDNEEGRRWEAKVDGKVVGFVDYKTRPGRVIFTHTQVDEAYEGQGIASKLAKFVLDDAVRRQLRITLYCPFITSYVERHPEYLTSIDAPPPR